MISTIDYLRTLPGDYPTGCTVLDLDPKGEPQPMSERQAQDAFEKLQSDFLDSNGMDLLSDLIDAVEGSDARFNVRAIALVRVFQKQWREFVEEKAG